jgi:hypothetical protein
VSGNLLTSLISLSGWKGAWCCRSVSIELKGHLGIILTILRAHCMPHQSLLHRSHTERGSRVKISQFILLRCGVHCRYSWIRTTLPRNVHGELWGLVAVMPTYHLLLKHTFLTFVRQSSKVFCTLDLRLWGMIMFHVVILRFGELNLLITNDESRVGTRCQKIENVCQNSKHRAN